MFVNESLTQGVRRPQQPLRHAADRRHIAPKSRRFWRAHEIGRERRLGACVKAPDIASRRRGAERIVTSSPLIVIGLDGADRHLVSGWCDSGDLPTLRRIRDAGLSGRLETPPALGDDAVWPSMYTGESPARHGRYHHRQLQA